MLLHELRRRVVSSPADAEARFVLGEALYGEQKHTEAATQLEKALALHPKHENARRLLVRAYVAEGRNVPAERTLTEAVALHPADPSWRDELAKVLISIGRKDDALLQLEAANKAQPGLGERLLAMAQLHLQRRHPGRARPLLEEALRQKPPAGDPRLAEIYRETLLQLGDVAALDFSPLTRGRDFLLGRTRQALRDPFFAELLAGPLQEVAEQLHALDVQGAKRALLRLSGRAPVAEDFLRGELLLLDGEIEKAERFFLRAATAAPKVLLLWKRLAELRQHRGADEEALQCVKKVLALSPKDAETLEQLGDLHARAGRKLEARTAYQQATVVLPSGSAAVKLSALLGVRQAALDEQPVGFLHALGWNRTGGVTSPLEALAIAGKGELLFSGNMGPAGQEAARIAFSCLKARGAELGLHHTLTAMDLHLHFVDTEFEKDGPSAGLALFLAAASAFLQRPLPTAFAATGELTLHGAVRAIGGLQEKLVAAALAGIRTVMLPRRNLLAASELSRDVLTRVELIYVDKVSEALQHALPPSHTSSDPFRSKT